MLSSQFNWWVSPLESDLECPVLGGDSGGVISLKTTRSPVEANSFREGIVAGVKNSSGKTRLGSDPSWRDVLTITQSGVSGLTKPQCASSGPWGNI